MTTKEVLEAVEDLPLIQMSFDLSAKVSRGIEMMDSLGTLFSVKVTEHSVNLSDIQKEIIIGKTQALISSSSHADESSEWALKPYEANGSKGCASKPYIYTKRTGFVDWTLTLKKITGSLNGRQTLDKNQIRKWNT